MSSGNQIHLVLFELNKKKFRELRVFEKSPELLLLKRLVLIISRDYALNFLMRLVVYRSNLLSYK